MQDILVLIRAIEELFLNLSTADAAMHEMQTQQNVPILLLDYQN